VEQLSLNYDSIIPNKVILSNAYPNPFNPSTLIRYSIKKNSLVSLIIYDTMGRAVKTLVDTYNKAGANSVFWNATNNNNKPVSAGLYFYTIEVGNFIDTKKMILLK